MEGIEMGVDVVRVVWASITATSADAKEDIVLRVVN
jgi:hypothetical protein